MILLVTDTSGRNGVVALARAGEGTAAPEVIEVAPLAGGMFSAQLIPQVAALLERHRFDKRDIGGFVVVSGPGSFTGLRVGLAAIKALAEILQKPVATVSLLELVALAGGQQGRVTAVLDGGRREVFFAVHEIASESVKVVREELLSQADFVAQAKGSVVITPDATLASFAGSADLAVVVVDPPNAASIARLGWKKLQAGETVTPEKLEANYMRRSDAELFVKQSS